MKVEENSNSSFKMSRIRMPPERRVVQSGARGKFERGGKSSDAAERLLRGLIIRSSEGWRIFHNFLKATFSILYVILIRI